MPLHVTTGARFDEHRNTSRTWSVPPDAADAVISHLYKCRGQEWYRWATEGQPTLTAARYAAVKAARR